MITIQTRRLTPGEYLARDGSDAPPWVSVGEFDDFAAARPAIIDVMRQLRFDDDTNIPLLADELRPGFTDNPHENILTADSGHQIRVVPTDHTATDSERLPETFGVSIDTPTGRLTIAAGFDGREAAERWAQCLTLGYRVEPTG